jgi:soluble lytic murein transglycosylase-like protein
MIQIMTQMGQGAGSSLGIPLGASTGAPATSDFAAVFSTARSNTAISGSPTATGTTTEIKSALDWSGGADKLPAGTPYAAEFEAAGRRYGISPKLLAAQADVESRFRIDAVSPAGAQGIMQFMPDTARGRGVDPLNPLSAIDGAARYMRDLIGRFGTIDAALAAYNLGAGTVARAGGVVPPGARNYVDQILNRVNGRAS